MLQHESRPLVADNSGAKKVLIIQKLFGNNKNFVRWKNIAIAVVKKSNLLKKRTFPSSIHRILLIRTPIFVSRNKLVKIRFDQTAVIIINKKNLPLSTRIKGPVLHEICVKFPFIGTISELIL